MKDASRITIQYQNRCLVLGFIQPDAAINLRVAIENAVQNNLPFVSMDLDSKRVVIFVKDILWIDEEYLGVGK